MRPRLLAHRQHVVERHAAVAQALEHHVDGHQFAHRRGRNRLVRIALQQHRPGVVVDQYGLPGGGVEGVRARRERQRQEQDGGREAERAGPDAQWTTMRTSRWPAPRRRSASAAARAGDSSGPARTRCSRPRDVRARATAKSAIRDRRARKAPGVVGVREGAGLHVVPSAGFGARGGRAADGLDADVRGPLAEEAQFPRRAPRHVDDAPLRERAAVVHREDDAGAVLQIGDADAARHGQGGVRGRQRLHVVDVAVGGRPAVEAGAVPRRDSRLVVAGLNARDVAHAPDDVGRADLEDAGGRSGGGGRRAAGLVAARTCAERQEQGRGDGTEARHGDGFRARPPGRQAARPRGRNRSSGSI